MVAFLNCLYNFLIVVVTYKALVVIVTLEALRYIDQRRKVKPIINHRKQEFYASRIEGKSDKRLTSVMNLGDRRNQVK